MLENQTAEEQEQSIRAAIQESTRIAKLGENVATLFNSRLFKKVILEAYFEEEAIRLVNLKGAPSQASAQSQAAILRDIDGIGSLRQFLFNTMTVGAQMAEAAKSHEEELENLRNEQSGE